jgi:hypothetical protein
MSDRKIAAAMSEVLNKSGELHIHFHLHVDDRLLDVLRQIVTYDGRSRIQGSHVLSSAPVQQVDPTVVMSLVEKFVGAISRDKERDDIREERSRYRP